MQTIARVAASGEADRARTYRAARRLQVVHAAARLDAGHRARRMHLDAQLARAAQVGEGQLERVHADAVGLVQCAESLGVVDVALPHLVGAQDVGVVAEDLAHHLALAAQEGHLLLAVRGVQMATALGLASGNSATRLLKVS